MVIAVVKLCYIKIQLFHKSKTFSDSMIFFLVLLLFVVVILP